MPKKHLTLLKETKLIVLKYITLMYLVEGAKQKLISPMQQKE